MRPSALDGLRRVVDRSMRFRALDPALNAARAAGVLRCGTNLSALVHAAARRWPNRLAVVDDDGAVTYRDLDRDCEQLASYLRTRSTGPIGLMCGNHRGFVLGQLALERAGCDYVLLSTGLAAGDLAAIISREELGVVLADDTCAHRLHEAGAPVEIIAPNVSSIGHRTKLGVCPRPRRRSRVIILTSGTTGPPKGAQSANSNPSLGDAALLDALPIQMNDVTMITSPLFHAWGLAHAAMALATASTIVVQTKFDPATTLAALRRHNVTTLAVVPVILARLLDTASPSLDLPDLRVVLSSGNVLSGSLAAAWMSRFGYNLYNVYGSTETAIASVADPHDLVNAPGTVGRPPPGVTVAILDEHDEPVGAGKLGRVFTANSMQFEGYTDGTSRARAGKLMATGDLGYLDSVGRLFVDGRENDLIVTGGENVFPSRIEEVLEQHEQIRHAGVVGTTDAEFGERVAAFVVAEPGLDPVELDEWCRSRLATFERPREIHMLDELPMTTTGKIIRRRLAELAQPNH